MNTIVNAFRIGETRKVLLSLSDVDEKKLSMKNKIRLQGGILYEIDAIPMIRYTDRNVKKDNFEIGIDYPKDFDESKLIGKTVEII